MPKDFNYDMADILNEEREVKMREGKESARNSKNATKYNFNKEGLDAVVAEIKARGKKPTRERIAEELGITLPTLRDWFTKLEYKIPK